MSFMREIRKTVGKKIAPLKTLLQRLWDLNQFVYSFERRVPREPNIKPIRKTVGRTRPA